jgi:hypothetical protein
MGEAIFGLVGVVVGAVVAGGVDYALDRRRERAGLRAALRLVEDEYKDLLSVVAIVLQMRVWPPSDWQAWRSTSRDQWETHRDVLAARLSAADWELIAQGRDIHRRLAGYIEEHGPGKQLTVERIVEDGELRSLEAWRDTLERIIERIRELTGAPSRPGR